MVTLLLTDEENLHTPRVVREVYDPTAGTGGMLSIADDKIRPISSKASVHLLSQERRAGLISAAVTGQIDVAQKQRPVAELLEDEVKQPS